MDFGTITLGTQTFKLRGECYRDENDDVVFPLEDGTNMVCRGVYPVSLRYSGLECQDTEEITLVGGVRP